MAERKDKTPEEIPENQLPTDVDWENVQNVPKELENILRKLLAGWTITETALVSPENEDGFRITISSNDDDGDVSIDVGGLVKIKNSAIAFSGSGGLAIEHVTGAIALEVSGQGEGLGTRQIVLRNGDGDKYLAFIDNDDGTFSVEAVGCIPTSNPGGVGKIWSDGGTLKITS